MLRKKLNKTLLIVSSMLLSGCASAPPDFAGCASMVDTGYCRTYASKKKFVIDDKHPYVSTTGKKLSWKEVLATSVVVPQDQFVKVKTWFDNYCHQNNCPNGIGDWNELGNDLINHLKGGK